MPRDDWKYDEDAVEGDEEDKPVPPELPCPHCLHLVPREAPQCSWCGKPIRRKS